MPAEINTLKKIMTKQQENHRLGLSARQKILAIPHQHKRKTFSFAYEKGLIAASLLLVAFVVFTSNASNNDEWLVEAVVNPAPVFLSALGD